jgi:hypothetical protein
MLPTPTAGRKASPMLRVSAIRLLLWAILSTLTGMLALQTTSKAMEQLHIHLLLSLVQLFSHQYQLQRGEIAQPAPRRLGQNQISSSLQHPAQHSTQYHIYAAKEVSSNNPRGPDPSSRGQESGSASSVPSQGQNPYHRAGGSESYLDSRGCIYFDSATDRGTASITLDEFATIRNEIVDIKKEDGTLRSG